MKELIFKRSDIVKVFAELASFIDCFGEHKEYKLEIKENKQKRSLNANNYAWTLLDKLAERLNMAKTDIYKAYIKEIGGNSDVVCCIRKAADDLCKAWQGRGIGWIAECEESKIEGCTNIRLYYGSSVYDTAQMSRLINLIVQDCKTYDIPTWNEEELQRLCEEWGVDNG